MYMPCVKCACSELKLAKHLYTFFYKRSKQARVPTFVWLFRDVATTAKGPGCDEGTNLR